MKYIKTITVLGFMLIAIIAFDQRPREIQVDNEPADWTNPWTIALYVGVPILLIVGGLYIRNKSKNK